MKTLITNGFIVNEGRIFRGSILIDGEKIQKVFETEEMPCGGCDEVVDAAGCYVMPGVIDSHVHFREPGLTQKADIESESRAAAYGGVTTYFDMPNTVPQTTTLEALEDKFQRAARDSHVNYSFYFGATNDNTALYPQLDVHRIPAVKLFMGASTGNMLVDRREALETVFRCSPLPIMAHCEDTAVINQNMAEARRVYGDDPDVTHHAEIRSAEACWQSSSLAAALAKKYGARLHVAHLTTARELSMFAPVSVDGEPEITAEAVLPKITAEAVVAHLFFTDADYSTLGTRIKCNPAVKTADDRSALRKALTDGRIATIATDHAPHLLKDKEGGCAHAASGMPMVQFSLPAMLQLVDEGVMTLERMVELMCHNPARLFSVSRRGFLRPGYQADIVIVRPDSPWTVTSQVIQSKCGWSPLEGNTFRWRVEHTFCNGSAVYRQGVFCPDVRGQEVRFRIND
ncbi:MAG: dihydroorotase [Prevotella sp.]|nr:dihydroorotase [Prevotella sp.]